MYEITLFDLILNTCRLSVFTHNTVGLAVFVISVIFVPKPNLTFLPLFHNSFFKNVIHYRDEHNQLSSQRFLADIRFSYNGFTKIHTYVRLVYFDFG
jgi:hypothetical protein